MIAALLLAVTVGLASACSGDDGGAGDAKSDAASQADPSDANETKDDKAKSTTPDEEAESSQSDEEAEPDKKGRQSAVIEGVPGDKGGACVDTSDGRNVRSGQFLGGPFDEATAQWGKSKDGLKKSDVRLYWVPLHAKKMPGIVVVATHTNGQQVKVAQDEFSEIEQWNYYNVVMNLPQSGTWTLRGNAGPDRGCFKITVG